MTRKHDPDFTPDGVTDTAPGNPAVAHCARADSDPMHTEPGAVPPSDTLYHLARDGDEEALSSLSAEAMNEAPDAQYYLASFYLISDPDAAEAWLWKAVKHRHHNAALMLAGLLLKRCEQTNTLAPLIEAEPLLAQCAEEGSAKAQGAIQFCRLHGYEISQKEAISQ